MAIFLAAVFLLKLIVLFQLKDHALIQPEGGLDGVTYVQLAQLVLSGDVALGPALYFVSPSISIPRRDARCRRIIHGRPDRAGGARNSGRMVCLFSAKTWYGRRAGWIAATLAALTGVITFYEILILQSALDTFADGGGAGVARRCTASRGGPAEGSRVPSISWRGDLVSGVVFGLLILNRPNAIIAIAGWS